MDGSMDSLLSFREKTFEYVRSYRKRLKVEEWDPRATIP